MMTKPLPTPRAPYSPIMGDYRDFVAPGRRILTKDMPGSQARAQTINLSKVLPLLETSDEE